MGLSEGRGSENLKRQPRKTCLSVTWTSLQGVGCVLCFLISEGGDESTDGSRIKGSDLWKELVSLEEFLQRVLTSVLDFPSSDSLSLASSIIL